MTYIILQRRRLRRNVSEKPKPRKPVTKLLYVNWLRTHYVRKVVLFKPETAADSRRKRWNLPPVVKPRPWSKLVRRLQQARSNQITPRLTPPTPRRTDGNEMCILCIYVGFRSTKKPILEVDSFLF